MSLGTTEVSFTFVGFAEGDIDGVLVGSKLWLVVEGLRLTCTVKFEDGA